MTHFQSRKFARITTRRLALAAAAAMVAAAPALAIETKISGRITYGSNVRASDPDPDLLYTYNATAMGLTGFAGAGNNSDDGNNNYGKNDTFSRALKAYLDVNASEGNFTALLRLKSWYDFAQMDNPVRWGNNANNYVPGEPLSDRGTATLSKFSGLVVADAWVQHVAKIDTLRLTTRVGQQTLDWGARAGAPGGLSGINANDAPSARRAGAVPQEVRVPVPMLFGRVETASGLGVEAFYQTRFRPNTLDMCGTFGAPIDYGAEGCERAFAGPPNASDRVRLQAGAFIKRIANPTPTGAGQYGAAFTWKNALPATDLGLYHARYTNRAATPGLRKSSRVGAAIIAGDPDGKNVAYFMEYVPHIEVYALNASHKRGELTFYGELTYRPNQVLQLPPGDVLGAFLNPVAPALLRADATATPPGGIYSAYDQYGTLQSQFSVQREWKSGGGTALSLGAEVVHKHVSGLPDPNVRRYGRADQYGGGPVNGSCVVTTKDAAKQCTSDGYVSPSALSYRIRGEARFAGVLPGLNVQTAAAFIHDLKGWSYDGLINKGQKAANLAVRAEYRQRYLAEVVFAPNWNGDYNRQHDRDTYAFAVGVRF